MKILKKEEVSNLISLEVKLIDEINKLEQGEAVCLEHKEWTNSCHPSTYYSRKLNGVVKVKRLKEHYLIIKL